MAATDCGGFPTGVFTIPPGVRFIDALAGGLLRAAGGASEALASATILLPNRRSCRALIETLSTLSPHGALVLPEIAPIGDLDDGEAFAADESPDAVPLDIPPAISDLRRQLLLTRLILSPAAGQDPPDTGQAAALAAALARLLDQVHTARISFDGLERLVPAELAEHWQKTLRFLRLLTEHWPAIVDAEGAMDPALRRNLLIARRIDFWRKRPRCGPVVVAGSTGSVPATRDLMAWTAGYAEGAVVLPGLDREIDEASLEEIEPTHPQFGLNQVLRLLEIAPSEVMLWPGATPTDTASARARLIATAMRPPTAPPPVLEDTVLRRALDGVCRIDCAGPREEASTIALLLREALELEAKTAALVTPDRNLARRVAAELRRWNIDIDDSGGRRLDLTPTGALFLLSARLVTDRWAPVPLLATLKHPLVACGTSRRRFLRRVYGLERAALRGLRPEPGIAGLLNGLDDSPRRSATRKWIAGIGESLGAFERLVLGAREGSIADLAAAHIEAVRALAATDRDPQAERLRKDETGEAVFAFLEELRDAGRDISLPAAFGWPHFLETLMRARVVRPRGGSHPRLAIRGTLEARLLGADRIVLGGLNEGTWPDDGDRDPWLSAAMREALGLPSHQRRVGLAAHDFAQAFAAEEIFLTRATRVEGTPTVPSRWLLRLETARVGEAIDLGRSASRPISWQAALDRPAASASMPPPEPRPPVAARPRSLSATQIETLFRDPYAIYARHILGLRTLDPIDADPGGAELGSFVHDALDRFLERPDGPFPDNALSLLLETGRQCLGRLGTRPGVLGFWWPRFERAAAWFVETERARRPGVAQTVTEISGEMTLPAPAGAFRLTARADRIDQLADGTLVVIDYKTGALPAKKDIVAGISPQLVIEAAIAEAGGFEGLPPRTVSEIAYWRISGGDPPGEIRTIPRKESADGDLVSQTMQAIESLVAEFDDPRTAYAPQLDPSRATRFNDYLHLERLAEFVPDRRRSRRR